MKLGQDHSNGIFGTGLTNNFNSVFCLLLVFYCTSEYLHKKCSLRTWLMQIIVNFVIAAFAELKVLFFLIPVGILLIMRKKIFEKIGKKIAFFATFAIGLFLILFGMMYSDQLSVLLSFDGLFHYNDWGLATHAVVTRLNWPQYTMNYIFSDDIFSYMLGIGFGTISGSLYSSIGTIIYTQLGYGSYCASTVFLETGWIGLLLLLSWFIFILCSSIKKRKNALEMDFEIAFSICMIIFLVYANFIFNDSCFIAFYGIALYHINGGDISVKNIIQSQNIDIVLE